MGEHKTRKTFIGVKLDGRDIFAQPYTMALAQYQSVWATEIGLKITAVQTKEHKIGGELAERVDVSTDNLKFDMLGPFPPHVRGFFAELRGKVPMSERSKTY